jgi:carbonic anhydrase
MSPQRPHTAIVTCMDARLDALGFLEPWPETAHVIRTAGGRVTDDVLRSLAASCALGIERVIVMHHTDCAMAAHTDEQIRALLPPGPQPEIDFLTIDDPLEALAEDVRAVRASTLLPERVEIHAFIFDLEAGEAREVEMAAPADGAAD